MPNSYSKKQLILDSIQGREPDRYGVREIRAIESVLRRRLGPNPKISSSYIANVLRQSGKRVDYNDRYVDPWMEEPYASRLAGALQFRDFQSAEESLRKLDTIYREYRETADREGTSLIRALVLKGKQRAESMAVNHRLNPAKRDEKKEIAYWFAVWVDNVDLFFDWLEIRKQSEEFRRLFPSHDGHR